MKKMKNAVERRLDLLHDQWTKFALTPEARLLRWVVEPDEVRMVEAFLEKEGNERTGECPDLFLRFEEPFDNAQYGYALREALKRMAEESQVGLEQGESVWECPPLTEKSTDIGAFLDACGSLRRHYESVCEHLVVVLMPAQVMDEKAWMKWLWSAVEHPASPNVRMLVLDDARTLAIEPLAEGLPGRVVTVAARLDMGRALEELSQAAGHLNTPGGLFRDLFVRLGNATTRGELDKVEKLGAQAVAVALAQGWHSLAVAAHFAMGGALLGVKKPQEALGHYQKAEAVAVDAVSKGDPPGADLRLKSRMAQGAALVTLQDYSQAAKLYEETAPLARELKDARMELECWRMASWCREMGKEVERAWEHGQRAWEMGRAMDAETRASSTLPYVGEALVRLNWQRQGERAARGTESQVASVLGEDWRPRASAAGGRPA